MSKIVRVSPTGRGVLFYTLAVLWLETLLTFAWPLFLVSGVFLCLVLTDLVPDSLWAHVAWMGGVVLAFLGALVHFVMALRQRGMPNREGARARLDEVSGHPHRPFSSLNDRPAVPDSQAWDTLWHRHVAQARARLHAAPPPWCRPRLSKWWGHRLGRWSLMVVCLVLAGLIWRGAGTGLEGRFLQALTIDFSSFATDRLALDVWIDPPPYTGKRPIFLTSADWSFDRESLPAPVDVPVDGRVFVRAHGAQSGLAPIVYLDNQDHRLAPVGGGSYEGDFSYDGQTNLHIQWDGDVQGFWTLKPIFDQPPVVSMPEDPGSSHRLALRVPYKAEDDYGVRQVWADIVPVMETNTDMSQGDQGTGPNGDGKTLRVDLNRGGKRQVAGVVYRDLTSHPWAGRRVEIRLRATDAREQIASSSPFVMVLPERVFTNPLARDIIAQRKRLIGDAKTADSVARALDQLAKRVRADNGDRAIFLGLKRARDQLAEPEKMGRVLQILWDMAVRLEDGGLSTAERKLRAAQERLETALAEGASGEDISRLTEEVRQAMQEFLTEWQKQRDLVDSAPPESQGHTITSQNLDDMLDQVQNMARMGARDSAQQLLSQLRDMLESLVNPQAGGWPGNGVDLAEQLQALGTIARDQEDLRDLSLEHQKAKHPKTQDPETQDTEIQDPEIQDPGASDPNTQGQEARARERNEQAALRRRLGDLMLDFGQLSGSIPDDLGQAERAMRDAVTSLDSAQWDGQGGGAQGGDAQARQEVLSAQNRALAALQRAQREATRGSLSMPGGTSAAPMNDPFGRPGEGGWPRAMFGDVAIPDTADLGKVYEILRELRRRAGDASLPERDRTYIERLLPDF